MPKKRRDLAMLILAHILRARPGMEHERKIIAVTIKPGPSGAWHWYIEYSDGKAQAGTSQSQDKAQKEVAKIERICRIINVEDQELV